ncbi:MAG TPA: RHS repeat-associated core domain-containing protein [bacterium]|nr:RHS repeat-associated core domain-containing protein [bacterium]
MIKKDYDRLGSVRFMTDETGAIIQEYVYDAFGNLLSSSGSISQPYEYVGREGYYKEGDIGLYLLGQRWYESEVGRFVSRDLIGEEGGLNLYEYVRNNPIIYYDSEGTQPSFSYDCPPPSPCVHWFGPTFEQIFNYFYCHSCRARCYYEYCRNNFVGKMRDDCEESCDNALPLCIAGGNFEYHLR